MRNLVWLPVGLNEEKEASQYFEEHRWYDVLLNHYKGGQTTLRPEHSFADHDYKFHSVHNLACQGFNIGKYEYVYFPDLDLRTSTWDVNHLFEIVARYKLDLAMPSIEGYVSHDIVGRVPGSTLRYTNFVEPIAPMFSRAALYACLWTFKINYSAWGLDFLWAKLMNSLGMRLGIVDSISVNHTRPVASHNWVLPSGQTPVDELVWLIEQFQLSTETKIW